MNTLHNDIAGSAVFWTLGESTDWHCLSQAFRAAGLAKFAPEPVTNYAALRDSLNAAYPGHEVFPVKGATDTFEVVRVSREVDPVTNAPCNRYETILTARVDAFQFVYNPAGDRLESLTDAVRARKRTVAYSAVSRALVEIVFTLGGTTLRPSGGVYWIPNREFDRWQTVARAVELAGAKNTVFALQTVLDMHSAAVLREALAAEVAREAKEIDETLSDPHTGLKAARTAKRKAQSLRDKLEAYEQQFEMSLADLRKSIDEAVGIEAKATLMDMASDGPLLTFVA